MSFRKAAERLHMAQPPLSVAVRRMEEEFGGALFVRGRRGVKLTPLGEAILDDARQVVFHAEQLRQSAATALSGLSGSLRIGFIGSAIHFLLPRVIPLFRERYPKVVLQLHESTTSQILRDVESGVIDLGLIRYPIIEASSAAIDVVEHDTLVAALPVDNPLARHRLLRLAECADEPFIAYSAAAAPNLRGLVMLACQAAGFTPRIVQEAVQVQTLVSLVESGLGMAL
ncbi:MAG: LysR substrate-binding domain-containing protein, partial [Janthinobacterium lividum]